MLFSFQTISFAIDDMNLVETLQNMGFKPLSSPAIDFTLEDLEGKTISLKNYKGNWVFVVFWATWCGPCKSEMPTIEGLGQEIGSENLKIIGVATDQGPSSQIKKYIKQQGISFSIVHDKKGIIANKYGATSIPSIYLISPDRKIVGVLRGAKNWELPEEILKVKKLISFKDTSELDDLGEEEINQLEQLAPPEIRLKKIIGQLKEGDQYELELTVKWEGNPRKYFFKTPILKLPEDIVLKKIYSKTSSGKDESLLRYIFQINFNKVGEYVVGPIELSYGARNENGELYSRSNVINVQVQKNYFYYILTVSLIIIILLLMTLLFYKKRKTLNEKIQSGEKHESCWESKWIELRNKKLHLSKQEYNMAMLEILINIVDDSNEKNKINSLINEINYAGVEFSNEQVSHYEKKISYILNKSTEEI